MFALDRLPLTDSARLLDAAERFRRNGVVSERARDQTNRCAERLQAAAEPSKS